MNTFRETSRVTSQQPFGLPCGNQKQNWRVRSLVSSLRKPQASPIPRSPPPRSGGFEKKRETKGGGREGACCTWGNTHLLQRHGVVMNARTISVALSMSVHEMVRLSPLATTRDCCVAAWGATKSECAFCDCAAFWQKARKSAVFGFDEVFWADCADG